jgi:N-ethylmaleimide reductase
MLNALFSPVSLGAIECRNRIVMAPMTRGRAGLEDVPSPLMVEYYRQRASAGLIVTEGTQPSPEGKGYWRTPGIHTKKQIEGWSQVAEAVHSEGGKIVVQLMHCGRVVVPENRGYEARIIAPSAVACPVKVPGPDGTPVSTAVPEAILAEELQTLALQFAKAAENARDAGIDGVELHCASGYLLNQFLNPQSNQRTDAFGGSAANRVRFPIMVLEAVARQIGADRVGFRISPGNGYNGMDTANPWDTFRPLIEAADALALAYLHVVDMGNECPNTLATIHRHFSGNIIANNMLDGSRAAELIADGDAAAVSFGRPFIANPDLPRRLAAGAPLAKPDYSKLYTGEKQGYCDYPPMDGSGKEP